MRIVLIEARSVPYEATELLGERLLVLAPHPDDEAIGCGGVVAQHLLSGRVVKIVVATDGSAAGDAAVRQQESRDGISALGGGAEIDFLGFSDRALGDDAFEVLRERIASFRPDLVLVPSPVEIHPDHVALARLFCEVVQSDAVLFADLAITRVAFYEVGQPLRPNVLVDITSVAKRKWEAIDAHISQRSVRNYTELARALATYRSLTLPLTVQFAEAYYVMPLPELRTMAFGTVQLNAGAARRIETLSEPLPISVVVRTKERPALLREALESILATSYGAEIVIVNDGGSRDPVREVASSVQDERFRIALVEHETSRGRSEAANAGARTATGRFLGFLDDDDLFYPEHLETLAAAATQMPKAGWYSDALSVFLRPGESGRHEEHSRLRLYASDFDRELLLIDNFIPLPTLLVERKQFLDLGGFDPEFDLFEDWDFLIRLSATGDLLRIPRVTCEVRHFEAGDSILLATPEGSERFRAAQLRIWQKHSGRLDWNLVGNVYSRQKRRLLDAQSQQTDARGQAAFRAREIDRLEREKQMLIDQGAAMQQTIDSLSIQLTSLRETVIRLNLDAECAATEHAQRAAELGRELDRVRREEARARVEIDRLNGLMNVIFSSRTWKLHAMLEKLRGRG